MFAVKVFRVELARKDVGMQGVAVDENQVHGGSEVEGLLSPTDE
jgi:hypothetical protein